MAVTALLSPIRDDIKHMLIYYVISCVPTPSLTLHVNLHGYMKKTFATESIF